MQKVADAVEKYRSTNGALPNARDIVGLTDILHPQYMNELVREDGWGKPIIYEVTGPSTFRLLSQGADGLPGTRDDIVVTSGSTDQRSEEHTSELQSQSNLVCRLLLEKKKKQLVYNQENMLQLLAFLSEGKMQRKGRSIERPPSNVLIAILNCPHCEIGECFVLHRLQL